MLFFRADEMHELESGLVKVVSKLLLMWVDCGFHSCSFLL